MVSRIQATMALVRVEVVSFATLFHRRKPIIGQGAKVITLLDRRRGFDLEVSREKRLLHACISDVACLCGARARPQHDCCSRERAD